jgi:altronate hydrolase
MQDKPDKKAPRTLRLNARDNVIVAVDSVEPGVTVQGVKAAARIMRGHKMSAQPIAKGQPVLKFGQIIGFATEDIAPGSHVHTHNCSFAEFERDYAFAQDAREEHLLPPAQRATFEGFRRANGKAGTRNYIGILTTSMASSRSCTARAAALRPRVRATRRWSARSGATPATPTSPRRWWWVSAARCSRSPASRRSMA